MEEQEIKRIKELRESAINCGAKCQPKNKYELELYNLIKQFQDSLFKSIDRILSEEAIKRNKD